MITQGATLLRYCKNFVQSLCKNKLKFLLEIRIEW